MTSQDFRRALTHRASLAQIVVAAGIIDRLHAYIQLLARWNSRLNLTALDVATPSSEAIDRLLIEPLKAAQFVDDTWTPWFDVGSGGGSPAIPLKLARPRLALTMVESKSRKTAFLREAVRVLGLEHTSVETARFEDFAARDGIGGTCKLATIRAVRVDSAMLEAIQGAMRPAGVLAVFETDGGSVSLAGFAAETQVELVPTATGSSILRLYRRLGVS